MASLGGIIKASQLYVGEYYAHVTSPPKGRLATNGKKVRLRGTETRKSSRSTNARTFALITVVDTGQEKTVRARELVDFWNNYEGEIEAIKREQAERAAQQYRTQVRSSMVEVLIAQHFKQITGIDVIGRLSVGFKEIRLPIPVIFEWLDITEEEIEKKVDNYLEGENGKV